MLWISTLSNPAERVEAHGIGSGASSATERTDRRFRKTPSDVQAMLSARASPLRAMEPKYDLPRRNSVAYNS